MVTYIKRPLLTPQKKEALIAYLNGETTQEEASAAFDTERQTFTTITNSIFRALVMEGKIDIHALLRSY